MKKVGEFRNGGHSRVAGVVRAQQGLRWGLTVLGRNRRELGTYGHQAVLSDELYNSSIVVARSSCCW